MLRDTLIETHAQMTIKQYAEQLGITATEEQLEKLKEYVEHKPKAGEVYLLPCRVTGFNGNLDVTVELPDGCKAAFYQRYFTPDRLASTSQTKFKFGDEVRIKAMGSLGRVVWVAQRYTIKLHTGDNSPGFTADELELVY